MTAYEMRISEWSADVCSSDLRGSTYYAGNKKLLEEQGISLDNAATQKARSLQDHAKTVIYFADNRQALAILAIADTIKPTSKKDIETLQKNGIDVYMLTGYNRQTAAALSKQTGLRHNRAKVMYLGKADFDTAMKAQGKIEIVVSYEWERVWYVS